MPGRPFTPHCAGCAVQLGHVQPQWPPCPSLVDYDTCVTCHDEASVVLEIHDDTFDSGRLIAPSCDVHLVDSYHYLLTVEAPRRGWRYGLPVTNTPQTAL